MSCQTERMSNELSQLENVYQIETWAADRKHCKHCKHCKPTVSESPAKASKAAGDSDWDDLHNSHDSDEFELCSHLSHFAALRTWDNEESSEIVVSPFTCHFLNRLYASKGVPKVPGTAKDSFKNCLNSEIWKAKMAKTNDSFKSWHVSGPFQFRSAASRSVPEVCDSFEKIQS